MDLIRDFYRVSVIYTSCNWRYLSSPPKRLTEKTETHDPQIVHLCADKLKNGIDALEKVLVKPEQK
jgi:hypothetical protein